MKSRTHPIKQKKKYKIFKVKQVVKETCQHRCIPMTCLLFETTYITTI